MEAHISLNPYLKKVNGKLTYKIKPLKNVNVINIDAPGIHILKVKKGWFKVKYKMDKDSLKIYKKFKKGKIYTFHITYEASPKQAMYFTGWKLPKAKKQIWTQGQGKGNRHWIPLNEDQNDKFPWELHILFDKNFQVVSNGLLVRKKRLKDSLMEWTYVQNKKSPAYLLFLGIGKYVQDSLLSNNHVKIYNYSYPEKRSKDKTYYKSKEIFDFLEKEIGIPYAWDNYKQIPLHDFLYGGMENVSVSSFNGNRYVVDSIEFNDINFVNVSAHELAHQWFGDLITGKTSSDHWLHEGFATYYARLSDAHIFGKEYNDYKRLLYDAQIVKAAKKDTISIHRPNASSLSYYQKGARVVQMLREKLGDSIFTKTIQSFLKKNKFNNVEIKDLQQEFFLHSGDSLKHFFHLWLDSPKIPKLEIISKKDSLLFLHNEIPQGIPFLFIYPDTIIKKKYTKSFRIPRFKLLESVIPNTDNALLAEIKFNPKESWVEKQILKSPYFSDKYLGLKQLKTHKDSIYNLLLTRNEYYPIYENIIEYALKNHKDKMIKALFKKDLKTRQILAKKMKIIPPSYKEEYKKLLSDSSYVTKEVVLWHYFQNFPQEISGLLEKTKNIHGGNDHSFRLSWLTISIVSPIILPLKKKNYIKELISYTSPQYNMETRMNAFETLKALDFFNLEALDNLMDASLHFNWRLHQPARKLLEELSHRPKYRSLILSLLNKRTKNEKNFFKKLLKLP